MKLSSIVAEQNKLLAARVEEIRNLKEACLTKKKGFQSLTTNFVHVVKLEFQRLLSVQHADFDFTPIHQLSLKDLSKVIRREREKAPVDP